MKEIIDAIVLGIVQGLGEFLPISSSGHLVLAHKLGFDLSGNDLAFDVALHFGTLIAVLFYFKHSIYSYLRRFIYKISLLLDRKKGRIRWFIKAKEFKIFILIILATIPGALAGLFLDDFIEEYTRSAYVVSVTLIFWGIVLIAADKLNEKIVKKVEDDEIKAGEKPNNKKGISGIKIWKGIVIGLSQMLAIIPGTSRSGITITAALFLGLKRPQAARFSFILSIPIIAGASMVKIPELLKEEFQWAPVLLSVIVSCTVGFLAIKYLIKYVSTRNYLPFGYYRIGLGALILVLGLVFWIAG